MTAEPLTAHDVVVWFAHNGMVVTTDGTTLRIPWPKDIDPELKALMRRHASAQKAEIIATLQRITRPTEEHEAELSSRQERLEKAEQAGYREAPFFTALETFRERLWEYDQHHQRQTPTAQGQ